MSSVDEFSFGHWRAKYSRFGAQLLSLKHKDNELLYLSPTSIFDDVTPIRGGVPLCWPWFGNPESPSQPAHGYARTSVWTLTKCEETGSGLVVEYQIPTIDDLNCTLQISLAEQFSMSLITTNLGNENKEVSAALHSYFSVSNIRDVQIKGLERTPCSCKLSSTTLQATGESLSLSEPIDSIFHLDDAQIELKDQQKSLKLANNGSTATVVWNPGDIVKADLPKDAYLDFVCIESAIYPAKQLKPGHSFTLSQIICL